MAGPPGAGAGPIPGDDGRPILVQRREWCLRLARLLVPHLLEPAGLSVPNYTIVFGRPLRGHAAGLLGPVDGQTTIVIRREIDDGELIMDLVLVSLVLACCPYRQKTKEFEVNRRKLGLVGSPTRAALPQGSPRRAIALQAMRDAGPFPVSSQANKDLDLVFYSPCEVEYKVKVKRSIALRYGLPRDYRGIRMIPLNPHMIFQEQTNGDDT